MIEFTNTKESLDKMDDFFERLDDAQRKVKEYKKNMQGKDLDDDIELKDIIENIENLNSYTTAIKIFLAEYILVIAFSEAEEKLKEIIKEEIKGLEGKNAYKILSKNRVVSKFYDSIKYFLRYKKGEDEVKYTDLDVDLDVLMLYLKFRSKRNKVAHEGGEPGKVSWGDMHGQGQYSHPETADKKIYEIGEEIVNAINKYIRDEDTPKDDPNSQDSSQD